MDRVASPTEWSYFPQNIELVITGKAERGDITLND